MKQGAFPSVDLRGFGWRLAVVERLRQYQVDGARARVAQLQRQHQACQSELGVLRAGREQALQAFAPEQGGRVDPVVRSHAVRHLHRSLSHQSEREQHARLVLANLEQAQRACTQAQQRLDAARKFRERALAAYVQEQVRGEARSADFAWLARHGGGQGIRKESQ